MKKSNSLKIMAVGLAACALASAAFARLDGIYDLTVTYKCWYDDTQKVQNYKAQEYIIFDNNGVCQADIWYWREGSAKYYVVYGSGSYSYSLKLLGDAEKTARFSLDDGGWAMNGFGTARRARDGQQLSSLSVTGAFCVPGLYNGTVRVRFNKSLTSKAAKNSKTLLQQVVEELERKGYVEH
jgi:hypothetical protein